MDLLLSYELDGDTYNATFHLEESDEPRQYLDSLAGVSWSFLLRGAARHLAKHPTAGFVMARSDHPLAVPYRATQDEVDVFRRDPVEAIRMWTYEPKMDVRPSFMPPIQAGYATLASSLGDVVHARYNTVLNKAQSPFTGEWVPVQDGLLRDGPWAIGLEIVHAQWASMTTTELLAFSCQSYYLPALGFAGGWVSHEDLKWRYESFVAERCEVR